jgi:molecular chaperone DnaK
LGASEVDSINAAITDLKKALESNNTDEIKTKMEDLNKASHKISEMLYKNASAQPGAEQPQAGAAEQPSAGAANKDEDIVDAEFEVEDDKKK